MAWLVSPEECDRRRDSQALRLRRSLRLVTLTLRLLPRLVCSPLDPAALNMVAATRARAVIVSNDFSRPAVEGDAQCLRAAVLLDEMCQAAYGHGSWVDGHGPVVVVQVRGARWWWWWCRCRVRSGGGGEGRVAGLRWRTRSTCTSTVYVAGRGGCMLVVPPLPTTPTPPPHASAIPACR